MSRSVTKIIEEAGSAHVAEALSLPARNVRMWKMRDRIPGEYWRGLARNGLATLEELADAHASQGEAA